MHVAALMKLWIGSSMNITTKFKREIGFGDLPATCPFKDFMNGYIVASSKTKYCFGHHNVPPNKHEKLG